MATVIYSFNRLAKGRYEAINPNTGKPVCIVFGSSNDWRVEQLDGKIVRNAYARKQDAAAFNDSCR